MVHLYLHLYRLFTCITAEVGTRTGIRRDLRDEKLENLTLIEIKHI